jgi:hypothetical protein
VNGEKMAKDCGNNKNNKKVFVGFERKKKNGSSKII